VSISQKSGEQLLAIVPRIEKTANLVQEIAAASLEQDAGAEQINKAIQQLNMVSQQNASSSEEMAANSEELASQAISLQQIISYFKVAEQIGSSKMPELNEYPKKMKKEKLHRDDSKFTGKAHYKGEVTNIDKKILKSKIVTEKADNPKVNKGFQLQFTSDDKSDIDFKSF
jgi:methyl-accepting chemotaxis protein